MARDFYQEWFGVAPGDRPPDHYALLGVTRFTADQDAIEAAARARMDKLDQFALHPDRQVQQTVQRMMNEVAFARVWLVHASRKAQYDAALAARLGVEPPAAAEQPLVLEIAEDGPDPVEAFEQLVRTHMGKWQLNAHEEVLLLAEASRAGIEANQARRMIHQIDEESEVDAARAFRRWTLAIGGVGVLAVVGAILAILIPYWVASSRQSRFEDMIRQANALGDAGEYDQALDRIVQAEGLQAGRDEPQQIRQRLADKLVRLTRDLLDRFEPDVAEEKLATASRLVPSHGQLPRLRKSLAGIRQNQRSNLRDEIVRQLRQFLSQHHYEDAVRAAEKLRSIGESPSANAIVLGEGARLMEDLRTALTQAKWDQATQDETYLATLNPRGTAAAAMMDAKVKQLLQQAKGAEDAEASQCLAGAAALRPSDPAVQAARNELAARQKPKAGQPERPPTSAPSAGTAAVTPKGMVKGPWADAKVGQELTYEILGRVKEKWVVAEVTDESVILVARIDEAGRSSPMRVSYPRWVTASWERRCFPEDRKAGTEAVQVGDQSINCDVYAPQAGGVGAPRRHICREIPGWVVREERAEQNNPLRKVTSLALIGLQEGVTPSRAPLDSQDSPFNYPTESRLFRMWHRRAALGHACDYGLASRRFAVTVDQSMVLAVVSGSLQMWDIKSGRLVGLVPLRCGDLGKVRLDRRGGLALAWGRSNVVAVADVATRQVLRRYEIPEGVAPVEDADFIEGDQRILVASTQGLRLCPPSGVAAPTAPVALAGRWTAVQAASTGRSALAMIKGQTTLVDLPGLQARADLTQAEGPVVWAAFTPDARRILTVDTDGGVGLWDPLTGKRTRRVAHMTQYASAVSPDGSRIVMGSPSAEACVYDDQGAELAVLSQGCEGTADASASSYTFWAAFNPSGTSFVAANLAVQALPEAGNVPRLRRSPLSGLKHFSTIWNSATCRPVDESLPWVSRSSSEGLCSDVLLDDRKTIVGLVGAVPGVWELVPSAFQVRRLALDLQLATNLYLDGEGRTALTFGGFRACLWDLQTARAVHTFDRAGSYHVKTNSTGRLAYVPQGQSACVVDLATGKWVQLNASGNSFDAEATFSDDGATVALQGVEQGRPFAFNCASGKRLDLPAATPQFLFRSSVSPTGRYIAGADNTTVHVWDLRKASLKTCDLARADGDAPGKEHPSIHALLFVGNGPKVGVLTSRGLYVVDGASGSARFAPGPPGRTTSYFSDPVASSDGKRLAASTNNGWTIWNLDDGTCLPLERENGRHLYLSHPAFSPNGRYFGGESFGKLCVWDAGSQLLKLAPLATATGQESWVGFALDGNAVVSRTYTSLVRRDLPGGATKTYSESSGLRGINGARLSPNGRYLAATGMAVKGSGRDLLVVDLGSGDLRRYAVGAAIATRQNAFLAEPYFGPQNQFVGGLVCGGAMTVDLGKQQVTSVVDLQGCPPYLARWAFASSMKYFGVIGEDCCLHVYDTQTGKPTATLMDEDLASLLKAAPAPAKPAP